MTVATGVFSEYWDAVLRGDSAGATALTLSELGAGTPVIDLLEQLVCAAQARVGGLWASNEWNVAQEHRATSVGEDVVAALAATITTPPTGRHIVITCADGEWHALPSRVLAAALRAAGHRVTFLGASVPVRHFAQLLHESGPDVTAISCALPTRLSEARRMIEVSREAGIPTIVGGAGFGPGGVWAHTLGADSWAPDARAAVAAVEAGALPAFTSPAPPLPDIDGGVDELRARSAEIVASAMHVLRATLPEVPAGLVDAWPTVVEDIAQVIEFLQAALFVDDERLFTDFADWLRAVLLARGVPAGTLSQALRLIGDVIASRPGPHERTLRFIAQAAAAVDASAA